MMTLVSSQNKRIVYILAIGLLALLTSLIIFSNSSWAAQQYSLKDYKSKRLELVVGKSVILKSPDKVKRISVAAPEVADFKLLSLTLHYGKIKRWFRPMILRSHMTFLA